MLHKYHENCYFFLWKYYWEYFEAPRTHCEHVKENKSVLKKKYATAIVINKLPKRINRFHSTRAYLFLSNYTSNIRAMPLPWVIKFVGSKFNYFYLKTLRGEGFVAGCQGFCRQRHEICRQGAAGRGVDTIFVDKGRRAGAWTRDL